MEFFRKYRENKQYDKIISDVNIDNDVVVNKKLSQNVILRLKKDGYLVFCVSENPYNYQIFLPPCTPRK